jgi:hypothetical protein
MVHYIPGEQNVEADELSRNPSPLTVAAILFESDVEQRIGQAHQKMVSESDVPVGCVALGDKVLRKDRLFVPESLRKELMHQHHLNLAHLGATKLYHSLRSTHSWPKMKHDIHEFVFRCVICNQTKSRHNNNLGLFAPTKVIGVLEYVIIDSIGGLGMNSNDKKYAHVAIDHLSRHVWHTTSKTQDANDFVRLVQMILAIGAPRVIRTDQYPALRSKVFRNFCNSNNILLEHAGTGSHESVGIVERVNSTLVNPLRAVMADPSIKKGAWAPVFEKVVRIYNTTYHRTIKCTPRAALLGTGVPPEALSTFRNNLARLTADDQKKSQVRLNRRRHAIKYSVGDKVLLFSGEVPNRAKLDPLFIGPYPITKVISNEMYELQVGSRKVEQNNRLLRPYFQSN